MKALKHFCRLLCPLAITALSALAPAAQTNGYLTVGQPQRIVGKRGAAVQSKIPCAVQPGFHVNSNTPSDDYLIPLSITWTTTGALRASAVTFPKPSFEKSMGEMISVFTGKFDLIANFKVAPNAPAGPGIAVGRLRYQACNDRACFQPKTVEVSIPYQVE